MTADVALEAIAWVHGLPRLAVRLPASLWSRLLKRIIELAAGVINDESLEDAPVEHLIVAQLAAGELPLALAYVFPKVQGCQEFGRPARTAIARGLLASLDGEGILHARLALRLAFPFGLLDALPVSGQAGGRQVDIG